MVILAFGAFLGAIRRKGAALGGARAADAEKIEFSARDIFAAVARYRHLQAIIAITLLTFIVDELVDFQFQAMAKHGFRGDQVTAFFGGFFVYLNLVSLALQLLPSPPRWCAASASAARSRSCRCRSRSRRSARRLYRASLPP